MNIVVSPFIYKHMHILLVLCIFFFLYTVYLVHCDKQLRMNVTIRQKFLHNLRCWKVCQNACKYEARRFFDLSNFMFSFCLINNATVFQVMLLQFKVRMYIPKCCRQTYTYTHTYIHSRTNKKEDWSDCMRHRVNGKSERHFACNMKNERNKFIHVNAPQME